MNKPNLLQLFRSVLNADYIQLEEETASYAYERCGDTLYLFFEWSRGKTDWKNNFDFPAKPYRSMKNKWYAHRGFLRVWKVIEDELAPIIADPVIKNIIIAGYSHGGAIAMLCHEYCVFNRPELFDTIVGVGFGAPRVRWGWCSKTVKQRWKNFSVVRNHKDIVTHVPPCIFGYKHVGALIKVGKDKSWNSVDCHRPQNYIESLQEVKDE